MRHRKPFALAATLLASACGSTDAPSATSADELSGCTRLVCGPIDCGPQLGPAGVSDASLGFDIHPGTGNLHLVARDIAATPAVGTALVFERHYNSAAGTTNHGFGAGWTHSYSWRLAMPDENTARIVTSTGRTIQFTGGSPWTAPTGEHGSLTGKPESGFTYTTVTGTQYRFDTVENLGRLLSIQDPISPAPITLAYDKTGALASVTSGAGFGNDGRGSTLVFATRNGYIESITDPAGRIWQYGRDSGDRLNLVTLPTGGQTSYTMTNVSVDGASFRSGTGQITRVQALQSAGVWIDRGLFSYEGDPGQVTHAASGAVGGALQHELSLSYALCTDAPSTTIATLAGGTKTIQLAPVAGQQRLSSIAATAGSGVEGEPTSQAFSWNPDLTLAMASAGAVTHRYADYDAAGNAQTVIEGAGSPVERTTRFTFHPVLQTVLTESRPSVDGTSQHVTTYDYDADYDTAYNAAPTTVLHQIVETGKTDTALAGTATSAATYTTRLQYDAYNRPTQITLANGLVESYAYFPAGATATAQLRLASHTAGGITDQNTSYDANGRVLEAVDPNGVVTAADYDELGNVTRTTVTSGSLSTTDRYAYNLAGELVTHTSPGNNQVIREYDAAARPWRTHAITAAGTTPWSETRAFDAQDRVLALRRFTGLGSNTSPTCAAGDEAAFCESMTYDAFRRRASVTLLSSTDQVCAGNDCRQTYSYDANGNVACSTEAGLHTTCFARDGRGRLSSVLLPTRVSTRYAYDLNDNLTTTTDPKSRASRFVWDDFGREISRTTIDAGQFVANFDGTGLRTSTLDARGVRMAFAYDAAGRQIRSSVPSDPSGNQDLTYTYDETGTMPGSDTAYAFTRGRLTTIAARGSDGTRIVSHTSYDYLGRPIDDVEERGSTAVKQHYALGADGELLAATFPSGKIASYQFDASAGWAPRPLPSAATTTFNGASHPLFSAASYSFDGALRSLTYANGEIRSVSRNKRGDVTRILSGPMLDPWVDQRFDYDARGRGRVTAVHNFAGMYNAHDWTYDSDDLGRSTGSTDTVTGQLDTKGWTYDEVGNRLTETRNGATSTYHYANPATNRLTSITGGASDAFTYDANGFIASHTTAGSNVSFAYDARSRLSQLRDETSVAGSLALPSSITFTYLATSCGGGANIAFSINGTLAAKAPANAGCTCSPGVATIVVTDPAILGLLASGKNTFTVSFPQYLAWAVATVNGNDFVIYDAGPQGDARTRNPDLCGGGYGYAAGPQTLVQPSLGSVTFTWLATSCSGAQPINFSINGTTAYSGTANAGCTCAPGVASYKTSDAAVLNLLHGGVNAFGVGFSQYIDWAVVSVEGQADVLVYDPSGHAAARDPNLCVNGMGSNINASASSQSYAPRSTASYTYDANGRIWERRLSNGRFTQTYYDASGRISEEKEFRGELAFGDPVYAVTDYVHASGLLVAELTRVCKRPSAGAPYTCIDDDVRTVSEDMRAPVAVSSMYAHPGLTWGTNTDAFGNWSNLGSLRGTDGRAPTSDDLAMTTQNLLGHDITHNDAFDGVFTTGLGHGDQFALSATGRLGGPQLAGFDASSYTTNVVTSSLGQFGSFHAPAKGNGPEFNGRHDPFGRVGYKDGKLEESDDNASDAPTNASDLSNPTVSVPTPPPADPNVTPPSIPAATPTTPPVVQALQPVITLVSEVATWWSQLPLQPGRGAETDVHMPPLPNDTIGIHFTVNAGPFKMCNPDAGDGSCGGDFAGGVSTKPHIVHDLDTHPMNPVDGSGPTILTRETRKPSAIDPVDPKEAIYNVTQPNIGDEMCADSTKNCGTK